MDVNNLFESLKVDLTCHMCLGYFHDPVIVKCGHSFCKECLLSCWNQDHTQVTCPICKSILVFGEFGYNRRLLDLAIIGKMLRPHLLQSTRDLSTCDKHGKEETWFCEEDHRPLHGPCFLSTEHKEHKVLPLQRAASQCMGEKQLHLQRLDQQLKDNLAKFEESKGKITQQIHDLEMVISEINKTFEKLPTDVLQDAKGTLERNEELFRQNPVVASPRWTMDPIPGMREMLLTFQRDITLDPETANPHLILSDELKSVKYVSVPQDVPDNPKRFDFALRVLATQSFTSGKHYWEVEVENKTEWEVGLCRESIGRKGNVHKQPGDTCSLVAFAFGNTFHLLCSNHPVPLNQPMHKVGIFLDYERGHIAFYNATDGTLIYSPPNDDFQGALWPCFSPCF
ncbi:probable E3 ubiquitin-protein ligase TRIML1 [Dromiciops gliroides]|uniref:probable E3 ubiquitin-protein ligase TRIML1 n=1 Tax=Dromiciops gliroides TaxID=33562 RepID=UPI001CC45382|nr:probable E3 ubiquitin-protein ligase TRIML1 [Dromiciops gliroides]